MKEIVIKWRNVALICLAVISCVTVFKLGHYSGKKEGEVTTLQAGDLVRHKLHNHWRGIVTKNQEGPTITIRWHMKAPTFFKDHEGQKDSDDYIWNDTMDVEWERE